jgi:tetratricopeptide (TPR) repeat protein
VPFSRGRSILTIRQRHHHGTSISPLLVTKRSEEESTTTTTTTAKESKNLLRLSKNIQKAMKLSNRTNISAAFEACSLWKDILLKRDPQNEDDNQQQLLFLLLPANVRALCHALHANSLVRCGDDAAAIQAFDAALLALLKRQQQHAINDDYKTLQQSILLGKASSLQRLLQYDKALEQFQSCLEHMRNSSTNSSASSNDNGSVDADHGKILLGAVTCAMRLGRLQTARALLLKSASSIPQANEEEEEVQVVRVILGFLSSPPRPSQEDSSSSLASSATTTQQHQIDQPDQLDSSFFASTTTKPSFLRQWLAAVLALQGNDHEKRVAAAAATATAVAITSPSSPVVYQSLLDINIGAWDDPLLVYLDDKVLLHQVLTQQQHRTNVTVAHSRHEFWPRGFILPEDFKQFEESFFPIADNETNTMWMLKQRAGYGSHGNQVIKDRHEVVDFFQSGGNDAKPLRNKQILLQTIVHPPLLLQDGRKFSLRIYVIYFVESSQQQSSYSPSTSKSSFSSSPSLISLPEVYISSRGLVKIAAIPFDNRATKTTTGNTAHDNDNDGDEIQSTRRMYMTNSGREHDMRQEELAFLQPFFEEKGLSYDNFWKDVKSAVQSVMRAYHDKVTSIISEMDANVSRCNSSNGENDNDDSNRALLLQRLARLGIPKVLGFDFVVDAHGRPWLVEVNRFPGLEPRDEQDQAVKHAVLSDTWRLAAQRMGMDDNDDCMMNFAAAGGASSLERTVLQ